MIVIKIIFTYNNGDYNYGDHFGDDVGCRRVSNDLRDCVKLSDEMKC